jgi:aspartyl-tRNA(Asn)/glutamyl-tRNA(Gln) amidotransferase subunit A
MMQAHKPIYDEGENMTVDLAFLSVAELTAGYRASQFSPLEVTKACLGQIARHNEALNAFNLVDEDGALSAARESEKRWHLRTPRGPIDGVPTAVKDLILTRGWPTLRGSHTVDPNQNWDEDAPSVARLREHGAVLLGKTTTPEFGWQGVTNSPLTGITRNPWNPDLTPGGSSGGSAVAVACGMAHLALGTDGGGSIRIPAAFTGTFGLKPSFGRVPAYPPSPFGTLAHVGPMARGVADAAALLGVIAAPDLRDPYALPAEAGSSGTQYLRNLEDGIGGLRLALCLSLDDYPLQPDLAEAVTRLAKKASDLGADLVEASPQIPDCSQAFRTLWYAGAANVMRRIPLAKRQDLDPGFREIAEKGHGISLSAYLAAQELREEITRRMNLFHRNHDLLITPALPLTAFDANREFPPAPKQGRWVDWTPFTFPFNLTGQPAASLPCGRDRKGLPMGLQIVGPRHGDMRVLLAARALERFAGFEKPPL